MPQLQLRNLHEPEIEFSTIYFNNPNRWTLAVSWVRKSPWAEIGQSVFPQKDPAVQVAEEDYIVAFVLVLLPGKYLYPWRLVGKKDADIFDFNGL